MKIVIDIDDEDYKRIQDIPDVFNSLTSRTYSVIRNGKPLPEHRRLIDADSLIKAIKEKAKRLSNTDTINGLCGAVALIFDAPTIIEADKGVLEKINEKQNSLRATCKAWDEAIEKDGYVN